MLHQMVGMDDDSKKRHPRREWKEQGVGAITERQRTLPHDRSLAAVPKPVADVKVEVIEGELLLYHPRQTRAVYLNPPAAIIWNLCDGHRDVHEIVRVIGETYPDAKANLVDEVFATLDELYESRVLVAG